MAGVTLPPAGSGRTFLGGCFFRSQSEARQKGKEDFCDPPLLPGRGLRLPGDTLPQRC